MRAHDFEIADNHTKTTLTIDEKLGAKFSWSADDIVGVVAITAVQAQMAE